MKRFLREEVIVDTIPEGKTELGNGFRKANDRVDFLTGNVLKVGEQCKHVSVGDKVVFLAKALNKCSYEDKEFQFVLETNIIGIDE